MKNIKKLFLITLACAFALPVSMSLTIFSKASGTNSFANTSYESTIETKYGQVIALGQENKVVLKATYENKGLFAKNIKIEVRDLQTDNLILTIKPKTNYGYLPRILVENFENNGLEQVYLGMSSGGSGGYGYSYVFDVKSGKENIIFDYAKFNNNNSYKGNYLDGYTVKVQNLQDSKTYLIDISLRAKEYLDQIYDKNGKLKEPKSVDIYDVSVVFPYFNNVQGCFQLIAYQKISGLNNADSLGYMVSQLEFRETFRTYFRMLGSFGY